MLSRNDLRPAFFLLLLAGLLPHFGHARPGQRTTPEHPQQHQPADAAPLKLEQITAAAERPSLPATASGLATASAASNGTHLGSTPRRVLAGSCSVQCDTNRAMVAAVNALRGASKAKPVCLSNKLIAAAMGHSTDMSAKKYFNHKGSDGSKVNTRVRKANFSFTKVAENIAKGYGTVRGAFGAWKGDSGHAKNILGDYTHTGAYQAGRLWTQVFAKSATEKCDS